MIQAIIFDFDGVIIDTTDIKTKAFRKIYAPFGTEIVEKAVDYHLHNGGLSRYKKIEYLHKTLLNMDLSKHQINELVEQFTTYVFQEIHNAKFVDGVFDFLQQNYKNYKMFISSGTPIKELQKIVEYKQIDKFFVSIHGSPQDKNQHISQILKENNLYPLHTLFIGDSLRDKRFSESFDLHFVARIGNSQDLINEKFQIKTFEQLPKIIRQIEMQNLLS